MSAPLNNEYWRKRADLSIDGKKLSIDELRNKLNEYIIRCSECSLTERDWVGKDAREVDRPKMLSMSIYGACAYIGIAFQTWLNWRKDEKYMDILTRVETIFKSYNIEGAGAGLLNQSVITRLEGLKDVQEIDIKDERENFNDYSTDELIKRAKAVKTINEQA